ncbi:ABC transporter ATP-binding protein [Microvirga puerhi]|uniref:ABC transporter ATP-binding protein n=1 Tax=Microvirga puerhi TaxID=2876078 RepID=A0ABS7VU19_9HYPH|nr:ABC transporter ATP-binding protein [Microvirga puerhi]MBZ6079082.1 ABC transporter ATP-binding protein [Microvirga puerhi]
MIECTNIYKNYGAISVLKGISLNVAEQETFTVIGPNGAGKTTLFKVLTGEIPANSGTVTFKGEDITRLSASARVHRGFGRTFQVARVLPSNSVLENIVIALEARARQIERGPLRQLRPTGRIKDEAVEVARRISLANKLDVPARFLSHGDRKRLELGITLALKPKILMMDEPTAGMSPSDRNATIDIILHVKDEDCLTIMLTEHDMDVVSQLSDRIMVMNYGETIAVGTLSEIRENAAVRDIYLGEEIGDA